MVKMNELLITHYPKPADTMEQIELDIEDLSDIIDFTGLIAIREDVYQKITEDGVVKMIKCFCKSNLIIMRKLLSDLEIEFNAVQNAPLTFDQVTKGRRKPVIWTCVTCGYSWPARVHNRLKGTGCPRCRGTIPIPGETDLATIFPRIANEWDKSRNEKGPEKYLPYSNDRVAWLCAEGHQWEEKINNRTAKGLDCPYCGGSRPIRFRYIISLVGRAVESKGKRTLFPCQPCKQDERNQVPLLHRQAPGYWSE